MKKIPSLLITLLFLNNAFSQVRPTFAAGFQLLGNSPYAGIRINRDFSIKPKSHFSIGLSMGALQISSGDTFSRPTGFSFGQELTYSIGRQKNFLELGLSGSYWSSDKDVFIDQKYNYSPLIGYKYISSNGIIGRIHFSPLATIHHSALVLLPYGGLSLSIYLKKNKS